MNALAKIAMVISSLYYGLGYAYIWLGQLFGLHNDIWDAFDFPVQEVSPPTWSLIVGLVVATSMVGSMIFAYSALWRILSGGAKQDFRHLAKSLRHLAYGLFGFWLSYNISSGVLQYLIISDLSNVEGFNFGWDLLDIDIAFAILSVAILAVSQTLNRAWEAEEEAKHFL